MELEELTQQIQKASPEAMKDVGEAQAKAIVAAVLRQIMLAVTSADPSVNFPGLGTFVIRKKMREVEGKQEVHKRVMFRPAGEMQRLARKIGRRPRR
jgi:nucleoid DNA-binding protein